MMFSWLIFAGMMALNFSKGGTESAFEVLHGGKTLKYRFIKKTILTISSSKQSFEEETSLSIIDDENLEMKTYPHGLRALFDIMKTKA